MLLFFSDSLPKVNAMQVCLPLATMDAVLVIAKLNSRIGNIEQRYHFSSKRKYDFAERLGLYLANSHG